MARILIVDDEAGVCSELAELLEEDRHVVECAENATQALEKIKTASYDVIFLDVLMPKIEGSEALVEIKKTVSTPVVIMSAYLAPDIEKRVLNAGAFTCIKKPFKLREIKSIIERACNQAKVKP